MEAGPSTRRTRAAGPAARTRIRLPEDPYAEGAPRPNRWRGPLIGLGLVLALFAVIAFVNRSGHSSNPSNSAATTPTATPSASPTGAPTVPYTQGQAANTADNVPVGYPHTVSGAEAAAANYVVAIYGTNMVYPWDRRRLVNAISDPAIASSLEGQFDAAYKQVDTNLGLTSSGSAPSGQTFVQRAAPVGVSLVSDSGDTATVSVWAVTFAGVTGTGSQHPVQEDWVTVTVVLNWTHGDWKWFSFQSSDGPAPLSGQQVPAPGSTLQSAVSQYGGLRYGR